LKRHRSSDARHELGGLVLGVLLLVSMLANSANVGPLPPTLAGRLGALTGLLFGVVLVVWLIASGLPKTIGSKEFMQFRRRSWYKLLGLGLVITIVVGLGLTALSWVTAGVLVTWFYWFGWTWISWRMADAKAQRRFQQTF
jgi:hypothetical protein